MCGQCGGRTLRQNGSHDHVMVTAQEGDCDHVLHKSCVRQRSYNNGDL